MAKGQSFIKNIKQLGHVKSEPNKGSKSCDINHVFKASDNQFFRKNIDWNGRIEWYFGFNHENNTKSKVSNSEDCELLNRLSDNF